MPLAGNVNQVSKANPGEASLVFSLVSKPMEAVLSLPFGMPNSMKENSNGWFQDILERIGSLGHSITYPFLHPSTPQNPKKLTAMASNLIARHG